MAEDRGALVVDDGTPGLRDLVSRIRRLGVEAERAEGAEAARALLAREGERVAVVFVPARLPEPELKSLASETAGAAALIATGQAPSEDVREILRGAGIEQALWEPYDDGALRFVVNEQLTPPEDRAGRAEIRVPTTLFAKIEVGARRKDALVYNLSASGLYLETPRPSMRGARLQAEIPLPDGDVRAPALVVYTNVPGNLQRPHLPFGMGVRFLELDPGAEALLRRYVEDRAARFRV